MTNQERMERIELPEELDQVILEAVDLGKKAKTRQAWKRAGLGCAGAAAALAVLVSAGYASPVAARAFEGIPAVGKVFTYLYDLTGYESRYAQIAEDARPAAPAEQQAPGGEKALEGQQIAVGQQGTSDGQGTEAIQNAVTASDAGITVTVKEYFCDKRSLYLSMTIESDEPFFEGGVEENTGGYIQLFTREESLSYDGAEAVSVGNNSLLAEGVFLDNHTFAGIARSEWSNLREESSAIPDEMVYTASVGHLKVYAENGTPDYRGQWEFSMNISCDADAVEILPVEAAGADGSICEVRLQPYEVQVAAKGSGGATLTEEAKMLVAFDGQGCLLDVAGNIVSYKERDSEIYEFARPESLEVLELFIVDEGSWMDQWKGKLYDGTMTGHDMVEFLKENCLIYASVECDR
ncbi:MAG: DUF4179 domain-containing protein [Blautia sp.]|nr:DUF4179 domain-containing protein [Blautia sp.]